jgi:hypothetical protein
MDLLNKHPELKTRLEELEIIRDQEVPQPLKVTTKAVLLWGFLFVTCLIISVVLGIVFLFSSCLLFYLFSMDLSPSKEEKLKKKFKFDIVKTLVEDINPNTIYYPERSITYQELQYSDIFERPDISLNGEDCIKGRTKNNKAFEFAEYILEYSYKAQYRLFFTLEMDYNLETGDKVILQPSDNSFGSYLQTKLSPNFKEAARQNGKNFPKLAKQFHIYGTNETLVNQLLTEDMINVLLQCETKWGRSPAISFKKNKLYILFLNSYNLFEMDVHQSFTKSKLVDKLYQELHRCFELLEDFSQIKYDPRIEISIKPTKDFSQHLLDDEDLNSNYL